MSFVETQFPSDISYGATGGAVFSTDIIETFGGFEQRNINWAQSRARYNVAHGVRTTGQMDVLIAFFRARRGKAIGFRFKDWSDYSVTGQLIGTGDAANQVFQLVKTYTSGSVTVSRDIKKPVSSTETIYLDGVPQGSGYTLDTTTGIVNFTAAPGNGVLVTADFEFDVPVRFDTDEMAISLDTNDISTWGAVPLIEVRV